MDHDEGSGVRPRSEPPARVASTYIVGPIYDWLLFLAPPLLALGIGILISGSWFSTHRFDFWGHRVSPVSLFLGMLIHAHLVIVFFRSHGNRSIHTLYPWRFMFVPVVLYAAMISSTWVLISVSVLATFWDVYHSGMQTFGFGRIYESKIGNAPTHSRRLDWWVNQLLYAGPIMAGATMMNHVGDFRAFSTVKSTFFTSIPAFAKGHQAYLTWPILVGGTAFLIYYVYAQWRFYRQGHKVSFQKVFLLSTTGFVSIYTWGFNSWGKAFFIMNVFHAVQYFGLVWATEKKTIMRVFRVQNLRARTPLALLMLVGSAAAYGYFVEAINTDIYELWAITLVVSTMHFWYDGFIWSVQKKQV